MEPEFNNTLENNNIKIEQIEKRLFQSEFIKNWEIKKFPEWRVKYISDDLYWVFPIKNGISYYIHENWNPYFNVWNLSESKFFNDALKKVWYVEKKEDWVFNIYKIDESWKVADLPIDKYSEKYFQIWKNIDFFIWASTNKQEQNKRLSKTQFLKMLPDYIGSESFRIKDLMEFYWRKQIDKDDIIKYLSALEDLLKKQCDPNWDLIKNFEKVESPITESEIEWYYKNRDIFEDRGLIGRDTAEICIKWIRKRENDKKVIDKTWDKLDKLK